jgi:competence protein ComEC
MIMIAFDGNCLYDLGFQLSFLAVFGILNYQKTITRLLIPSHRLTVFFWEATAVAIAAQLFTLPIILYTFHTFPNYFLVANLLVVVVSALAMYVGFIYLFLTFVPTIGEWVGELFNAILYALHQGLHGIANFSGSVENGFQFSLALLFFLHTFHASWTSVSRLSFCSLQFGMPEPRFSAYGKRDFQPCDVIEK